MPLSELLIRGNPVPIVRWGDPVLHHPCQPVRFRRANGREVAITDVGLGYPVPRGSRTVHVFDVTDGQSEYRLELDAQTLRWRLVREVAYSGE